MVLSVSLVLIRSYYKMDNPLDSMNDQEADSKCPQYNPRLDSEVQRLVKQNTFYNPEI